MRKAHLLYRLVCLAVLLLVGCEAQPTTKPVVPGPSPTPIDPFNPAPRPDPCPVWPHEAKAVASLNSQFADYQAFVNGRKYQGKHITCDLPGERMHKNLPGSDGAGLCVFASCRHCGEWQGNEVFSALLEYMTHYPGGGYPQKVDKVVAELAHKLGKPVPTYYQVTGKDTDLLCKVVSSGRMVGVTYNHSPSGRYGGGRIAHMVNCVYADGETFVILDNNFIGEDKYEWLTRKEFESTNPDWFVFLADIKKEWPDRE